MSSDNRQNILGYDSDDNRFASTNVVANADGSIIERQEFLQSISGGVEQKALTTTANGNTTIFNYTGAIEILSIVALPDAAVIRKPPVALVGNKRTAFAVALYEGNVYVAFPTFIVNVPAV